MTPVYNWAKIITIYSKIPLAESNEQSVDESIPPNSMICELNNCNHKYMPAPNACVVYTH